MNTLNTISVTPEQVRAAAKTNLEAIIEIATTQAAAVEKIANLQAVAIKSAFEDTIANVRALAGANDVQEFVKLQGSFAQPAYEKAMAYSKGMYEVATQANANFVKVAERSVAQWNEGVVSFLDQALEHPGRVGCGPSGAQAGDRRRQLGLREPEQGHQAGDRDGGSERRCRERIGQGLRGEDPQGCVTRERAANKSS